MFSLNFLNSSTTRTKLNGKATTGGGVVTTRDDIFASQQKNIHVSKKNIIIIKYWTLWCY